MDPQAAAFVMVDTALRIAGIELIRVILWGGMATAVTTYGVVLQRFLKRK